jgi:hypothetical protein
MPLLMILWLELVRHPSSSPTTLHPIHIDSSTLECSRYSSRILSLSEYS